MRFTGSVWLLMLASSLCGTAVRAAPPASDPLDPASDVYCDAPVVPAISQSLAGNSGFAFNLSAQAKDERDTFYDNLAMVTESSDPRSARPTVVMQRIDSQSMQMEVGAGVRIDLPVNPVALALEISNHTTVATAFNGDNDEERLWGSNPFADPGSAEQAADMLGDGSTVSEAGLTLARAFGKGAGAYRLDASLKAERVDLYNYDMASTGYYRPLSATGTNLLSERQGFNFKAGLAKSFGDLDMALNVANLFPRGGEEVTQAVYENQTQASVATSLDCGWSTARLNLTWNAREGYQAVPDQRYATAGMSFAPQRNHPRINVGYRHDLIGDLGSTASLGLGFTPLKRLNLDIAGTKGQGDVYGVMARLGLRL